MRWFMNNNYRGPRGSQYGNFPPNKHAVRRRRWRAFFSILIVALCLLLIFLLVAAL